MKDFFDFKISQEIDPSAEYPDSLVKLFFDKLNSRSEDSTVILGHVGTNYVEISLEQFRFIVFSLFTRFKQKGIEVGDTVFLASIPGNNELFIALMFAALASYGARVLLPMFVETHELTEWMEQTGCRVIILPETDVLSLEHHDKEKQIIKEIKRIAGRDEKMYLDIFSDLALKELVGKFPEKVDYGNEQLLKTIFEKTSLDTESLLITTSGSTGKSKLVHYNQEAFLLSCLSWQQSGLFDRKILGGRCFTPLFSHTMGIRAFFNAIWTGIPVCLINTEWFAEKPEIVRYLLLKMKPEHITGGPSVYTLLLELMRCFPELKTGLLKSFKTLISCGAPIDKKTIAAVESAFGVRIYNAYGTTETQQVLSSVLLRPSNQINRESLGAPLPGVKIGLKKIQGQKELYALYIKSAFGMNDRNFGSQKGSGAPDGYFNTGDIVRLSSTNLLFYEGRAINDFIKDGFGVKIPVALLHEYYKPISCDPGHIEFYPINGIPGLAALFFINDQSLPYGKITSKAKLNEISGRISEINNRLFKTLEPFEYRHRSINRFILLNSEIPVTAKGNLSRLKLKTLYSEEIRRLTSLLSEGDEIKEVKEIDDQLTTFTHHHNPHLGKMLMALGVGYSYHKAKKDSLYTFQDEEEIEILDFTGGFGTNLLGHNNEKLKSIVADFLKNDEIPISDQGSIQKNVGGLAEKLNSIVGGITRKNYNVIFGSTGSEAVEIALHHAFLAWQKDIEKMEETQYQLFGSDAGELLSTIWKENNDKLGRIKVSMIALKDAFHGHSTGARTLLGNSRKREKFKNFLGIETIFTDDTAENWKDQLEEKINNSRITLKKIAYGDKTYSIEEFEINTIIGAIAEPIVGEGGIRIVNREFLHYLSNFNFPLIIDEIQCGLGRSGTFLASEGISADYYLFAKALGGNIEKIAAVLIDKRRYIDEFSDYYSSTFANGALAAKIALQTLTIIENDNICDRSKTIGQDIKGRLTFLKNKFPNVIQEITGKGLMQGIKFCDLSGSNNLLLRSIYNEKYLGLFFSAYLLKEFGIRILPSISSPNILRIEPSAYITEGELEKLYIAIERLCEEIEGRNMYNIFRPLMDNDPFTDNKGKIPDVGFINTAVEEAEPGAERVAMIGHFVFPPKELRLLGESFCKASDTGLWILFNRFQVLMQMKPILLFSRNILNRKIHFSFILIPVDSAELEKYFRQKKQRHIVKQIQKAVDYAIGMGIKTISLGAYTSIISNNGLAISNNGKAKIITGNTLTAASGIKRVKDEINNHHKTQDRKILGVVGAAGNIGSIIAQMFFNSDVHFERVILFGRNKEKLKKLATDLESLNKLNGGTLLQIADDLNYLKECNVIIAASNTNDPIIFPHHIDKEQAVIISDLAMPPAVAEEVFNLGNVVRVSSSSYIAIPGEPDLLVSAHTPRGTIFCCGAEGILNGLEPIHSKLIGRISIEGVNEVTRLAEKYNFFSNLGDVKSYKTDGYGIPF